MSGLGPRALLIVAVVQLVAGLAVPGVAGAGERLALEDPRLPLVAVETSEGVVVQRVDSAGRVVVDPLGLGPAWSPDGGVLAWSSPDDGWHVALASVTDGELGSPVLHPVPEVVGPLTWAPDASAIAFATPRAETGATGSMIAVVHATSGEVATVSAPPEATFDTRPAWSPAGDRIAFLRRAAGLSPAVVTVDLDGEEGVLTERLPMLGDVAWTPAGDRLVIAWQHAVDALDAATGERTIVYDADDGPPVVDVAVAPDGRTVAIADGTVALAEIDGGGDLTRLPTGDVPLFRVAWTPLADAVVASGYHDDSGCHCQLWETWVLPRDGSPVRLEPPDGAAFDPDSGYDRPAPAVRPPDLSQVVRAAGESRVETAVAASRLVFEEAIHVVLARADAYPDALAGGPLTGLLGPVLLTGREELHPAAAAEIDRLSPNRAFLMGDASAVGEDVADALRQRDIEVVRISGPNRFATAAAVAAHLDVLHDPQRAYVVEGGNADPARGWPDAVAASGLATATARPILLVEHDRLPAETAEVLRATGIPAVTIVGGTAAVSSDVQAEIEALGIEVDRLDGPSRFATSAAIAEAAAIEGLPTDVAWIVTGANWPDALAAGPAAAADGAALLLAPGDRWMDDNPTRTWLARTAPTTAVVVGGPDVLSPQVAAQAAASLARDGWSARIAR